jgi:hypothetical protein
MEQLRCPSCGGPVLFQSSVTVFAVCGYCRGMIVRDGENFKDLGKVAKLPPDYSCLQLGTQGRFKDRSFTLLGRVRLNWGDGAWTEWFASFADGRAGWLAQAQGLYMVSFEIELGQAPHESELAPGRDVDLKGILYKVADIKRSVCEGSEGELPFVAAPGERRTTVDLKGPGRDFASLEYAGATVKCYAGSFATFRELEFKQLRAVPGWNGEPPPQSDENATALSCPKCGSTVAIRFPGQTVSATCNSCASIIDVANPQLKTVAEAVHVFQRQPLLPIGARGVYRDVEYEVSGCLRRKDSANDEWSEYLLYNPFHGYAWLTTYQGHWNFVTPVLENLVESDAQVKYEGRKFRVFSRGTATIIYVIGEFYWRIRVGEITQVADFVSPPYLLSKESYPDLEETTWSHGEYVSKDSIELAFGLATPLRKPFGPYLNQPNPWTEKLRSQRGLWAKFAAALLLIELISLVARGPSSLVRGEARPSQDGKTAVSEEFDVSSSPAQSLDILLKPPKTKANPPAIPAEVDGVLVNVQSGERITFRSDLPISGVSPGRYALWLTYAGEPVAAPVPFEIKKSSGEKIWSNFWIALIALSFGPIWSLLQISNFEQQRWLASGFADGESWSGTADSTSNWSSGDADSDSDDSDDN